MAVKKPSSSKAVRCASATPAVKMTTASQAENRRGVREMRTSAVIASGSTTSPVIRV
jgi:hypothetical protein